MLPDENEEALATFVEQMLQHLQPEGEAELLLAERIIAAAWRLRRVYRVETGVLSSGFYDVLAGRARQEAETCVRDDLADLFARTKAIADEAKYEQAQARAAGAAAQRDAEETALGVAFARDVARANALPKLARYETSIERGMYRALQELERIQQARRAGPDGRSPDGGPGPAPIRVVD